MGSSNLNTFIVCERCGKKLIERMPNGVFHFIFGKPGEGRTEAPVDLYIQGNIKIRCIRRTCGHWQILSYLPNLFQSGDKPEVDCANKIKDI